MYRYLSLFIFFLGIGTPLGAAAAIEISEIAWMGGLSSPNHEWIELFNSGTAAVVVDGWTLADGNNFLVTLAGTIPAGAYVVLERTSDDSAPGAAFLIYTGALVNTGTTLTLRQSDGQIADQVVGGSDWGAIGGDNTTKETAQRVGGAWRTGTPTPGRANSAGSGTGTGTTGEGASDTESSAVASATPVTVTAVTTKRSSGSSSDTIPLRQATTELTLALDVPSVAYERQAVAMNVVPSGIGRTITESLNYEWNFGDFTTASGSKVSHRFTHPGTYLVAVRAHYGRHDVVARQAITILPVTVSVTRTDEAVFLNNDAVYDIDVSGFRVVMGKEAMTFPPYSFVAAKQSVRLPLMNPSPLTVWDSRGAAVVREATVQPTETLVDAGMRLPFAVAPFNQTGSINTPSRVIQVVDAQVVASTSVGEQVLVGAASTTAAPVSSPEVPPRWPYALLGLVLIAAAAAVVWPRPAVSLSDAPER